MLGTCCQVRVGMTGVSGLRDTTPLHKTRELTCVIIQLACRLYIQNTSTSLSKTAHGHARRYRGRAGGPDALGTSMDAIVNEAGHVAGGHLLDSAAPARSQVAHGPHEPRLHCFVGKLLWRATEALHTSVSTLMRLKARRTLLASSRARLLIICPFTERTRPAQAQTSPLRREAVSAGDEGSTDVGQSKSESKSATTLIASSTGRLPE